MIQGRHGSKLEPIILFTMPLLFSLGIAALFYPGFMSFDTLHALQGAREGVTDSMWPPMVSYVWRAVDLVSHNPSAMHFSQVFLLLLSVFLIVYLFTKKISYAVVFLVIYLSIPVILGTLAVIWKDVLMASFLLASFAVIILMRRVQSKRVFVFLFLLTVFLIFLGVCSRHNAITAAIPLIVYLSWVAVSTNFCVGPRPNLHFARRLGLGPEFLVRTADKAQKPLYLGLGVLCLSSVLTGTIFFTKLQLDKYSLPGFVKMDSSTNEFLQSVRILDIAGASLCVGSNLFAEMAPNLSIAEIQRLYEPKHMNLSLGLLSRVGYTPGHPDNRIDKIWLATAIHHPICFFYNKAQLTKYLVGANPGEQFLITSPAVNKNDYGYTQRESFLRNTVVAYIIQGSHLIFFKPWFFYLISIGAFVYLVWARALTVEYGILVLSALLYFVSLVVFGNAADARLPFYTTTTLLMLTFISFVDYYNHAKNHNRS